MTSVFCEIWKIRFFVVLQFLSVFFFSVHTVKVNAVQCCLQNIFHCVLQKKEVIQVWNNRTSKWHNFHFWVLQKLCFITHISACVEVCLWVSVWDVHETKQQKSESDHVTAPPLSLCCRTWCNVLRWITGSCVKSETFSSECNYLSTCFTLFYS